MPLFSANGPDGAARGDGAVDRTSNDLERYAERWSQRIDEWGTDCRFALRACRRNWRFAILACLMITFGVGAAAAVFSIVDQVVLQAPPGVNLVGSVGYLQFSRYGQSSGTSAEGISTVAFDELRRASRSLAGLASYGHVQTAAGVATSHPIQADGNTIYGDFFDVLGVRPAEGRLLNDRDTRLGEDPDRIVLSQSLRNKLFGLTPCLGKSVFLNGIAFTVVGVTADGFAGPERGSTSDFWIPYGALNQLFGVAMTDLASPDRMMHRSLLVRLRAGVTMSNAAGEITGIVRALSSSVPHLAKIRPQLFAGLATPPILRSRTDRAMILLAVVAALVLLIVCGNMSNLFLVRSLERRTTTATALALGASNARLVRQDVAYGALLGVFGAVAAIPVAWALCLLLSGSAFVGMPVFSGLHLNGTVILFVLLTGILLGVLSGTAPAILSTRLDLASMLRAGAATHTGQHRFARVAFSTAQVAMSLTLTVAALLLLHTVRNLYSVHTGMDTDGVLALSLHHSSRMSPTDADALYRRVVSIASSLPDVEAAGLDPYGLPDGLLTNIDLVGAPKNRPIEATMIPVTPGLLSVLRIPIVAGRRFDDYDWQFDKPAGILLTTSLALKLFGRTDVVGRQIELQPPKEERILGVVGDIRLPYSSGPADAFFVTYGDIARTPLQFFNLLVRTRHFDPHVAQEIRAAVQNALPNDGVPEVRPLSADISGAYAEPILLSRLLSLLALFGIAVAVLALYAGVANTVEGRQRELAIRLALGANPLEIARIVAVQMATILSVGTPIGLVGAYALGRILRSELVNVGPIDPLSDATAVLLLVIVVALATAGPMLRAMTIPPVRSLREN